MSLEKLILKKAQNSNAWIVLPEAQDCERVLKAGLFAVKKKICNIIFLGDERLKNFECANIKVINPKRFDRINEMSDLLFELRGEKGLTKTQAKQLVLDNNYFSTMLLKMGLADGVVCGAITSSKNVIKPALQIIKGTKKTKTVSSCFLMLDGKKNFLFADCGVVENPNSEQLCEIAIASANSCESFLLQKSKVAFLSYSTLGSAQSESTQKVVDAVALLKKHRVKFEFDGELQLDAAINPTVAKIKAPKSKIAGVCNTLVFPNLDSGNIGYKLYQQATGCKAIGPIIQGLAKPVNDLSRGSNVDEIVLSIAITVLQSKKIKGED